MRIQRLQALMKAGNEAAAAGDFPSALEQYDAVVTQFPDFATTEYARLARGLMLYQLGRTSDAILQVRLPVAGCPAPAGRLMAPIDAWGPLQCSTVAG